MAPTHLRSPQEPPKFDGTVGPLKSSLTSPLESTPSAPAWVTCPACAAAAVTKPGSWVSAQSITQSSNCGPSTTPEFAHCTVPAASAESERSLIVRTELGNDVSVNVAVDFQGHR